MIYKVLYFQQDGLITGSAISLLNFISKIDNKLFEPTLVIAKEGPIRKIFEEINVNVIVFPFVAFWTFPGPRCLSRDFFTQINALKINNDLIDFVNKINPDIIHLNDKACLNVGISLKNKYPIVQHIRSSYFFTRCTLNKFISIFYIKKYSSRLIVISEDELDGFVNDKKLEIINNTVNFKRINKAIEKKEQKRIEFTADNKDILVGFFANVSPQKGIYDFLKIAKYFKKNKHVKFIIVGELGDQKYHFEEESALMNMKNIIDNYIIKHKLSGQVIYTGFRTENIEIMAAMDVILVPNKNGVLGRQPIEAQSLGIPVIAYDGHSKLSTIIEDDVSGFKVNSLNQMIKKLELLIKTTDLNIKIKNNARKKSTNDFSASINMKKIEKIYLELIKK